MRGSQQRRAAGRGQAQCARRSLQAGFFRTVTLSFDYINGRLHSAKFQSDSGWQGQDSGRVAAAEVVQAGGELHRVEQRGAAARQDLRHHRRQGVLRRLTMGDSSSDEEFLTIVNSQPKVFDEVPEDKRYRIKLRDGDNPSVMFLFVLEKGKALPYTTIIEQHEFKFGRDLSIAIMTDDWKSVPSKKFFCFSRQGKVAANDEDIQNMTLDVSVDKMGDGAAVIATQPAGEFAADINVPVAENINDDEVLSAVAKLMGFNKDSNNVIQSHVCMVCGAFGDEQAPVIHHIVTEHPNWRELAAAAQVQTEKAPTPGSLFQNPNWKAELINSFKARVIDKCSEATRLAWEQNEEVKDVKLFTRIRKEIIQTTEDHILKVCGSTSPPTEDDLREIIRRSLETGYPFMFGNSPNSASADKVLGYGYGRGGERGNRDLHKHMWRSIFKAQQKARKIQYDASDQFNDEQSSATVAKKGRRPRKYGKLYPLILFQYIF